MIEAKKEQYNINIRKAQEFDGKKKKRLITLKKKKNWMSKQ